MPRLAPQSLARFRLPSHGASEEPRRAGLRGGAVIAAVREGQRSAAAVCARGRRACVQLPPPATVTPVQRGVKQGRVVSERRAAAADGGAAIAASTRGPALRHRRRRRARHRSATLPSHRTGPHQVLSPTSIARRPRLLTSFLQSCDLSPSDCSDLFLGHAGGQWLSLCALRNAHRFSRP